MMRPEIHLFREPRLLECCPGRQLKASELWLSFSELLEAAVSQRSGGI